MPLVRRGSSSVQPQASIPDVNDATIDGTYSTEEQAVIQSLRADVNLILDALRAVGILQQVPGRDRTLLQALAYSPANNASYSYYGGSYDMSKLNDGNTSIGMIANTGKVFVQVVLSGAAFINKLNLYLGQFNGAYNVPRTLKIYSGLVTSDTDPPLFSASLALSADLQSFDLSNVQGFDLASGSYTFVFNNSSDSFIAVNELQIFGYFA